MDKIYLILASAFILMFGAAAAYGSIIVGSVTETVVLEDEASSHLIEMQIDLGSEIDSMDFFIQQESELDRAVLDGRQMDCIMQDAPMPGKPSVNSSGSQQMEDGHEDMMVSCTMQGILPGDHFIELSYTSSSDVLRDGPNYHFKSFHHPAYNTSRLNYILKLPEGYVIPQEKEMSFYITPKPASIYSDGRRIILLWEELDLRQDLEVSVMAKEPQLRSDATGSTASVLYIVVSLLVLALGVVLYWLAKGKKERISYPALVESEQAIVGILRHSGNGFMWQKEIQIKSGFGKVKVSRVLRSLENRGVIKKEPWGNTNKIYLIKED